MQTNNMHTISRKLYNTFKVVKDFTNEYRKISLIIIIVISFAGLTKITNKYMEYDPVFPRYIQEKQRVLIISVEKSGSGHKVPALALQKQFKNKNIHADILYMDKYWPSSVVCHAYDYIASSNSSIRSLYNKIIHRCCSLFSVHGFIAPGDFQQLIDQYKYDAVISVAPFSTKILDNLNNVAKFIIPTDLSRYNEHVWLNSKSSEYLLGSNQLYEQSEHIQESHKHRIAFPALRSEFFDDRKSKAERRDELGLDRNKKIILVCFGGAGSVDSIDVMNEVKTNSNLDYQYIFICGNNSYTKDKLAKLTNNDPRFIIKGYISDIHKWMQVADVLIGKSGCGIIGECIASNLPMIVSSEDVMIQDQYNLKMIAEKELGMIVDGFKSNINNAIDKIIDAPHKDFSKLIPYNTCEKIVDIIIDKTNKSNA